MTDATNHQRLTTGLDVLTSDGESLGTVSSIEGNYLVATRGAVFTSTTYIPVSAIATVEDTEVRIGLTGGEIRVAAWDQVPDDFRADASVPEAAGKDNLQAAAEHIPQSRSNTAAIRDDQSN